MLIEQDGNRLRVKREPNERKLYSESTFYHVLKITLNAQGRDFIKKLMWKDGHLMDQHQYYLRDRKWDCCIIDPHYALRKVYKPFNEEREVLLDLILWTDNIS